MPFPCRRSKTGQAGFALVAVIWTLGLITLLGMAVIVGARYRTKTIVELRLGDRSRGGGGERRQPGDRHRSGARPPEQAVRFPLRCRMPGGERATITIEEENRQGRPEHGDPGRALTRLFTALTRDQSMGTRDRRDASSNFASRRWPSPEPSSRCRKPGRTPLHDHDATGPGQRHLAAAVSDRTSPCHGSLRASGARSWKPPPPSLLRLLDVEPKQAAPDAGCPRAAA